MLRIIRDLSIRSKLTLVAMFATSLALVITAGTVIVYDQYTFREKTVRDLQILGDVIGDNSTAALSFNDSQDASEMLAALAVEEHITGAVIWDKDDSLFARYRRGASELHLEAPHRIRPKTRLGGQRYSGLSPDCAGQ